MKTPLHHLLPCLAACALARPSGRLWSQTPGTLDATFGNGGIVITTLVDTSAVEEGYYEQYTSSVAVQADGKILTGSTAIGFLEEPTARCALVRYNVDGTLDSTFGGGTGKVFKGVGDSFQGIYAILPQASGEIITVGDRETYQEGEDWPFSDYDQVLMRFLPDGSPKTSFGQNGVSILDWRSPADFLVDGVVLPDGAILGVGSIDEEAALIRCLADGSRDPSFGSGGALTFHPTPGMSEAWAIALQPDGKVIITGPAWPGDDGLDFSKAFLARCTANGTLDASFGNGGMMLIPSPVETYTQPNDIIVLPDGKIVLCGERDGGLWVARFLANGDRDTSFGTANGEILFSIPDSNVSFPGLALLPDERLVIAAGLEVGTEGPTEENRLLLLRLNPDGTRDARFGAPNGYVVHNPAGSSYGFLFSDMVLQPDGLLIVAGDRIQGSTDYFLEQVVARYHVMGQAATLVPPEVSISHAGSSISLLVNGTGQQGWTYEVQRSPDLGSTPWAAVHTHGPLAADGPVSFSFSDPTTVSPAFYRVVVRIP